MHRQMVDVNGYLTCVLDHQPSVASPDEGRDAPMVLVHGTPLDLTAWDDLISLLTGRRTVRYDVRGHGAADETPVADIATLADDLIAVLNGLEIGQAHLVGHSWGGQIVQQAAIDHTDRVRRLSLLCTRSSPMPAFAGLAAAVRAGQAQPEDSLERWFSPDELAQPDPLVATVTRLLGRANLDCWAVALDQIAGFDALARLRALNLPVDLLAADRDPVATVAHMAQIAAALPNAALRVLTDAGHLGPLQYPQVVADVITTNFGD